MSEQSSSRLYRRVDGRIDRAAIRRIFLRSRDWRHAGYSHKKITVKIDMAVPVLSSNGSQYLVVDRNKKLQTWHRKNGRVARGRNCVSATELRRDD
ncbi:hypothetical protein RAD15_17330 [Bradyrhizobium sp. 14AA]